MHWTAGFRSGLILDITGPPPVMWVVMFENRAHPLNVEGDFYVENGCCITCDLPRALAPDMFKYTAQKDHCYVYKQPQTADQKRRMIEAMKGAEVLCIRCRSRDKVLLRKLTRRGLEKQCDALETKT
jgi:hypothetical protein